MSICIDASAWMFYTGGIITRTTCGVNLNHCATVVGIKVTRKEGLENPDQEDEKNSYHGSYWIVKNSWGRDWGEDGYIRIQIDENACGVGELANFVVVEGQVGETVFA